MHLLKKTLKFLLYFFLGIVLIFFLVSLVIDPIAKNYLENQITEADKGQYTGQIDHVNISILAGNFIVKGIKVDTDTVKAKENDTPVIELEAGEISVEGFFWLDFLLSNKLLLERVSLLNLDIEAKVRTTADTGKTSGPFKWEDLNIYPMIEDQIDRVRLNDLRFSNIALTLINVESNDSLKFDAVDFNLYSDDILLDANKVFTDARAFYASRIDIQGKDVKINRIGNTPWQVGMELIEVETRESDFGLLSENFYYFMRGDKVQDTVLFASARKLDIVDLGLQRVKEDSVANIQSILLNDLKFVNNQESEKETSGDAEKTTSGFDVAEFSLGDNLPELLDKVSIEKINLQNTSYHQQDYIKVGGLDFSTQGLVIDKKPAFADNRFLHANHFEISIDNVSYLEKDQMLQIALNEFQISMENGKGSLGFSTLSAYHTERSQGEMQVDAKFGRFSVLGINTTKLPKKAFAIDSIAIAHPNLEVDLGDGGKEENEKENNAPLDLYPAIEDLLKEVQINKVAIIEGDLNLSGLAGNSDRVHLPAVYVQLSDIFIAEGTAFAGERVLHADDIAVRLEKIDFPLPDNVNRARLEVFKLSTREKFLQADGLSYNYNKNLANLLEKSDGNQLFKLYNNHLFIENLEYSSLIKEEGFYAGSIKLDGLQVEMFKDNHYPEEKNNENEESEESYPVPQLMIKNIEMPVSLDSVSVNEADLVYEELAEGGEEPGKFSLDKINLGIYSFTNVDSIIQNHLETQIIVNALLMNDGYIETEIVVPMHDEEQPVKITGKVDTLDLTKLNRYTEYVSLFGVESGMLYAVLWNFEAGKELANGKFGLSYEDLNIQLSDSESPEPAGPLYQVGAYLANALVLDEDISENKSDPPKTVEFKREKEAEESFIDHYISSLMKGLIEIFGFPLSIIDP